LLFCDESDLGGANYSAYLQKAGGDPPLRLGQGIALDLSPDGSLVLGAVPSDPPHLYLYPTGAGAQREISIEGFTSYDSGSFLPGGDGVLVCGALASHESRCFVRDLDAGTARSVTPDGTTGGKLFPDCRSVLARREDGSWARFSLEGGSEERARGLAGDDEVIHVRSDGRSALVYQPRHVPTRVESVDLATGARTLVRELGPVDRAGVGRFWWVDFSDDEAAYDYTYIRALSHLFAVEGVS
jgi:hypothetical protein